MTALLRRVGKTAAGRYLVSGMAAAFMLLPLQAAFAGDAYPARPVRIVLPFAAGGVADSTARIVAEKLGEKLGNTLHHRQSAGSRRHHRGARGAERTGGRLYAGAVLERHRRQRTAVQEPALRSDEGLRADLEPGLLRLHRRHQDRFWPCHHGRCDQGGQGEAGRTERRHDQCRQHAKSLGRIAQDRGGDRVQHRRPSRHAGGDHIRRSKAMWPSSSTAIRR